ncbi:transposase [Amycolatopsis sp. NPDC051903]|uniref:transposase n=1 Tax=Amycolatopsis sp. NPDC051903 TaxID=3363936 RepID=UPI0037A4D09A
MSGPAGSGATAAHHRVRLEGRHRSRRWRPPRRGRGAYLNEDDRIRDRIVIADRRRAGATLQEIADELGRDRSTISRELRRNAHSRSGDGRPHAVQARADARRPRPKPRKITATPELRAAVQDHLNRRGSPELIAAVLRRDCPDRPEMHVPHETIYQILYLQERGELRRRLRRHGTQPTPTQNARLGQPSRAPHQTSSTKPAHEPCCNNRWNPHAGSPARFRVLPRLPAP